MARMARLQALPGEANAAWNTLMDTDTILFSNPEFFGFTLVFLGSNHPHEALVHVLTSCLSEIAVEIEKLGDDQLSFTPAHAGEVITEHQKMLDEMTPLVPHANSVIRIVATYFCAVHAAKDFIRLYGRLFGASEHMQTLQDISNLQHTIGRPAHPLLAMHVAITDMMSQIQARGK